MNPLDFIIAQALASESKPIAHGALEFWKRKPLDAMGFDGPFVSQGMPTLLLYAIGNFEKFSKPSDVRGNARSTHDDVLVTVFVDE